jgi:hypothetical protein
MDLEALSRIDWIRAATLAHMLLSQSITDEQLDVLVRPTPAQPLSALWAA